MSLNHLTGTWRLKEMLLPDVKGRVGLERGSGQTYRKAVPNSGGKAVRGFFVGKFFEVLLALQWKTADRSHM
jgi:hypothetical protein